MADYLKGLLSQAAMDGPGYRKGLGMRALTQQGSKHWQFPKRGSRVAFPNDMSIPALSSLCTRASPCWPQPAQRKAMLWSCNAFWNVRASITRNQSSVGVSIRNLPQSLTSLIKVSEVRGYYGHIWRNIEIKGGKRTVEVGLQRNWRIWRKIAAKTPNCFA